MMSKLLITSSSAASKHAIKAAASTSTSIISRTLYGSFPRDFSTLSAALRNVASKNHMEMKTRSSVPPAEIIKDIYIESPKVAAMTSAEVQAHRTAAQIVMSGDLADTKPVTELEHIWPQDVVGILNQLGIHKPSPIQSQCWPVACKGSDIISVAQTGSGKTMGYALPIIAHIAKQAPSRSGNPRAIVLAPTRELAIQIAAQFKSVSRTSFGNFEAVAVYGGASRSPQASEIYRLRPEIVVATPGRLMDFIESGIINLSEISAVVLDEADRMLDMGFEKDVRKILSEVPEARQMKMFTATWPHEVRSLATTFMKDHTMVQVGPQGELTAAKSIEQIITLCGNFEKPNLLITCLQQSREVEPKFKAIVFSNSKGKADDLVRMVQSSGFKARGFHGDISQSERERTLQEFRRGGCEVLIATDAAARGLDVDDITLVINFDFPKDIEAYVHRIGRTGRAGKPGIAFSFFSREDHPFAGKLVKILKTTDQHVPEELESIAFRKGDNVVNRRFTAEYGSKSNDKSFGFGSRDRSYGSNDKSFGFGSRDRSYGSNDKSYGGDRSYGNSERSSSGYGSRSVGGDRSYGNSDRSYGNSDRSFGNSDRSSSGYGSRSVGGDRSYGNSDRSVGSSDRSYGGYASSSSSRSSDRATPFATSGRSYKDKKDSKDDKEKEKDKDKDFSFANFFN